MQLAIVVVVVVVVWCGVYIYLYSSQLAKCVLWYINEPVSKNTTRKELKKKDTIVIFECKSVNLLDAPSLLPHLLLRKAHQSCMYTRQETRGVFK